MSTASLPSADFAGALHLGFITAATAWSAIHAHDPANATIPGFREEDLPDDIIWIFADAFWDNGDDLLALSWPHAGEDGEVGERLGAVWKLTWVEKPEFAGTPWFVLRKESDVEKEMEDWGEWCARVWRWAVAETANE
ncbi:hypothetical protein BU16DRAFT_554061 [Lophium mytilinum]|uniref:Uncharacterized protein n=1 Tax=Lophium mytilinum TaxID=390894 RepID=A0A6A6RB14_9PEZI|nr:hypothetical protein BU16DRAFT_554061 [Lophium mytilinum]